MNKKRDIVYLEGFDDALFHYYYDKYGGSLKGLKTTYNLVKGEIEGEEQGKDYDMIGVAIPYQKELIEFTKFVEGGLRNLIMDFDYTLFNCHMPRMGVIKTYSKQEYIAEIKKHNSDDVSLCVSRAYLIRDGFSPNEYIAARSILSPKFLDERCILFDFNAIEIEINYLRLMFVEHCLAFVMKFKTHIKDDHKFKVIDFIQDES